MAWDSDKSTAADPDNPAADEQLTADEWDTHVGDQQGRGYRDLVTVTANHTASDQQIVLADASGGALTVTLPAPGSADVVTVKKIDASGNAVTLATPGSETIDGDSSRTISGENVAREVVSDGANYYII